MSDADTHLSVLFDEIAASIDPTPDFDAVVDRAIGTVAAPVATRRSRNARRILAVAAVAVVVAGGAAAALRGDGSEPAMMTTTDGSVPATMEPARAVTSVDIERRTTATTEPAAAATGISEGGSPVATRTAELGAGRLDGDPIHQIVLGRARPGELVVIATPFGGGEARAGEEGRWKVALELPAVPPATLVPIEARFEDGTVVELTIATAATQPSPKTDTATTVAPEPPEPKREPTTAPKPKEPTPTDEPPPTHVEFTAALGTGHADATPMKQVVYGTATSGTKILVTSAYGHVTTTAGPGGAWEALLVMYDVPARSGVRITATASGFAQQHEFWVHRPAPDVSEPAPFTADIGETYLDGDPVKVVFRGTGRPGSKVTATADYGVADAYVSGAGSWELKLKMFGVPSGTTIGITVTDVASGAAKQFSVTTPDAPTTEHHFKAQAAFSESDATPPYNEYWGTAAPGSTVTIGSPYGGAQVTVDQAGGWWARVEFPAAPIGETFQVTVINSADDHSFSFGFKRIASG